MVCAQSGQGIAGLIEDSRVSLERELRFLLKVAPTLESPIGRRRQYRMWDEVAKVAAECRVAPKALTLLAVLSSVVTVNRRANGTPSRRAKGTRLHDGARLIGHAPLRSGRRRAGGAGPDAREAHSSPI